MDKQQGEITRKRIYDFIVSFTEDNLYSPSVYEISEEVGISKSTVYYQLRKIEESGLIELPEYSTPRAIKLIGYKLVKEQ